MKKLRIVSWNLRTFGDPIPPDVALRYMAEIILVNLQADIICLQEIQAGTNVTTTIGCPVSPAIVGALDNLLVKLRAADPNALWQYELSGVNNSAKAKTMRDAYAFFWKERPSRSANPHADAPALIGALGSPVILRQPEQDLFPGRRPGMMTFEVTGEDSALPVVFNLISWHAATPCNVIGKAANGASSGRALMQLATLTEIGGVLRKDRSGGWGDYVWVEVNELPALDTIFVGDCNFTMAASKADVVYHNLTTNYQPCVSTFGNIVNTTYSADPSKPFAESSSYDNIFVLRSRLGKFTQSLSFNGTSGAFDFIADQARKLGSQIELAYFANDAAWYVCYLDFYKRQHAYYGVSDHLPVYADFDIGVGSAQNQQILPTSGADNNCLFHALFGTLFGGVYVDATAATRRTNLANWIANAIATNFGAVRQHVLSVMINEFQGVPAWLAAAQNLLTNAWLSPAVYGFWDAMVLNYLQGIVNGRMLWVDEAAMLALQQGITIRLHFLNDGIFQELDLNPNHAVTELYHFGLHFFRYQP
ncbi:hypothetical protein [Sphingomonas trueperi]|uniref:hypothetical protein n=1 Tax=Sphingomonas trueperi TaxID=53317 RepID=UPI000EB2EDE6